MKLLVEIDDTEFQSGIDVLNHLDFVKTVKEISSSTFEFYEELLVSSQEVKLHKEGKLSLKSANDLINEL